MTQHDDPHQILRITVRGRLSDRVTAGFDGMQVAHRGATTELVGQFLDQAQLHGLLTRIRDLGLDLESALVLDCPVHHEACRDQGHPTPDTTVRNLP